MPIQADDLKVQSLTEANRAVKSGVSLPSFVFNDDIAIPRALDFAGSRQFVACGEAIKFLQMCFTSTKRWLQYEEDYI